MRSVVRLCVLPLLIVVAACGGGSSPAGPSSNPSTSRGALINGVVQVGANASSFAAGGSPFTVVGVTVQVVGTNLTAPVDTAGAFSLGGVPPGTQQLRFTGPSLDASVAINDVQRGETITIAVNASGNSASIESSARAMGSDVELEGRVESLPPTQPAGTFIVAGRTVTTNTATQFRDGGAARTFADLLIGMRVHVKGTADGTALLAALVELQNSNTTIPVEINGLVENLSGSAAMFQFTVNDRLVKGYNKLINIWMLYITR